MHKYMGELIHALLHCLLPIIALLIPYFHLLFILSLSGQYVKYRQINVPLASISTVRMIVLHTILNDIDFEANI